MIISSIIVSFFKTKLLSFLKSKYFIYFLIIGGILSYILFLNISIKNKDRKIKKLYEEIYIRKLEISNIIINKEIIFEKEKEKILNNFSSSSKMIESIENKTLSSNEIYVLKSITNDYYKNIKRE